VSVVTDILDRLSGISALRERLVEVIQQQGEMRRMIIEQQKALANVQGQIKALVHIQSQAAKH
jgi:hypothetical protein